MISTPDNNTSLANLISSVQLFADIPSILLKDIIATAFIQHGEPGETLQISADCYIGLAEGEVQLLDGINGHLVAAMKKCGGDDQNIAIIYAPRGSTLRFDRRSDVVLVDGIRIDEALSHSAVLDHLSDHPQSLRERILWLTQVPAFSALAPGELIECAQTLTTLDCEAATDIISQGETGDIFYIIESGEFEVWREDPLEDDPAMCVATLTSGDGFGEEALLQDGLRNATVRATSNGRLLCLDRASFDKYLRAGHLQEIEAEPARDLIRSEAVLIDCRYEMEYDVSRIPGAKLIPLDRIREHIGELDHGRKHVVYCRTGRRSKAAAYLLTRQGVSAVSVKGGINDWPFEIEGDTEGY